ncbi:hypothetical protein BOA8489_00596 [Boseongicola aestuarii]|uniref:Uncharacterized protein n=2 Tax=Boseongicola aestuarii TaxID=1470561 RepID=A0A238IVI6_9RHOB|nr:hypothetical protein BOA8489_00596 [Boseongicola aestuarii]
MKYEPIVFAGELDRWPSKSALAEMFKSDGYQVQEGRFAIRLKDFDSFAFRELEGDMGPGVVTAESDSAEELIVFLRRVSQTLADADVRHRFEVYSGTDKLIAYIHHEWPKAW